jgi:hypothetical protein
MGRADERAEELVLAVLAARAQHTAKVAIREPDQGRLPPSPGVPMGPRRRHLLKRGLQVQRDGSFHRYPYSLTHPH